MVLRSLTNLSINFGLFLFSKVPNNVFKSTFFVSCLTSNKNPNYPPLDESQITETFSNGSGPGGQKTNKTHNRCLLKHLPTGN